MQEKLILALALTLTLLGGANIIASAQTSSEEITITTYYPSPYGIYKNLRLYPNDDVNPGEACANEGEMYFDDSDSQPMVCRDGATWLEWQTLGGGGGVLSVYTIKSVSYAPKTLTCNAGDLITGCLSFNLEACTGGNLDIDPEVDAEANSCSRGLNDCDYDIQIVCLDIN